MRKKKIKIIITAFILLLTILLNISFYFNLHSHLLGDGHIIVHSHPFEKSKNETSPFEKHQHTPLEYLIYSFLAHIELILSLIFILLLLDQFIQYVIIFVRQYHHRDLSFALPILRAPPRIFSH